MKMDWGTGLRYPAVIRMWKSSQFQISICILISLSFYDIRGISPILWLVTITICPSFLRHHECITQYQRRGLPDNSGASIVWQLWKHDSIIVQCDARGYSSRPEPYERLCAQPSDRRSFRRRRIQHSTSMCIPYQWYDDKSYFRLSYVTADKLIAGQYGFLNRLLYYCLILFAVLAASKSWLCWVRIFQNDHDRVSAYRLHVGTIINAFPIILGCVSRSNERC